MALHKAREQMYKLALLLRRQWRQNFFLHPGHIGLDSGEGLHPCRRHDLQLTPAVGRIGLAHHPALGLQTPDHRS